MVLALKGHTGSVRSATFSPDGSRLVTGSDDGTARVWDAQSGAMVLALKGHTGSVRSATFNPDGSRVLTASYDGTARVWDAKTGAEVQALKVHSGSAFFAVLMATFSPDGSQVVTGDAGGHQELWDPQTGHRLGEVVLGDQRGERCEAVSFSLGWLRVVTRDGGSGTVNVWNAAGRQFSVRLEEGGGSESVTFSPGGSRVLAGDALGTPRVWDAQSGALVLELKGHTGSVYSATFSPDGSRLVTGGKDGTARVWYAESFKEWTGSELRLISWGDGSGVPWSDKDLVIVGTDSDNLLHIRAFGGHVHPIDALETRDSSGALHLKLFYTEGGFQSDALESSLPTAQSGAITTLKQRLPGLLPPHVLSGAERGQVLSAVTLILGHRPGSY
jgi:WD40 repeat protein